MYCDELLITIGSECSCTDSPDGEGAEPLSINLHLSFNNNLDRPVTVENLALITELDKRHTLSWTHFVDEREVGVLTRRAGKAPFSIPAGGSIDDMFHFEIPEDKGCFKQWNADKNEVSLLVTVSGWEKTLIQHKLLKVSLINTIRKRGTTRIYRGEISGLPIQCKSKIVGILRRIKYFLLSLWSSMSMQWKLAYFTAFITFVGFLGNVFWLVPRTEKRSQENEQNNKTVISFQKDTVKSGLSYFSIETESQTSIKRPHFNYGYLDLNLHQKQFQSKVFNEIRNQDKRLTISMMYPTNHNLIVFANLQRDDNRTITSISKVINYDNPKIWELESDLHNVDIRDRWYVKSELEKHGYSFSEPDTEVGTTSATVTIGKPLIKPSPDDGNGISQPINNKP